MSSRRSPRRHTVHTKHPRYDVSQYSRGKGDLPIHTRQNKSAPVQNIYNVDVQPNEINAYEIMLKDAKAQKRKHEKMTPNDLKGFSTMSLEYHKKVLETPLAELALDQFRYWRYRAHSPYDPQAKSSWNLAIGNVKNVPRRVTKDSYYYDFPKDKFYIVRGRGRHLFHLYPNEDFELPQGFTSRKSAEKHLIDLSELSEGFKIVTGEQASKYPVPKRY